jgi:hypothetical protein
LILQLAKPLRRRLRIRSRRFANNEDPDDKTPQIESECNEGIIPGGGIVEEGGGYSGVSPNLVDGGGGLACPSRFKECKYPRHKPSKKEAEKARQEEEKLAKNAICAIGGGLIGGWTGVGAAWACSEIW